MTTTSELEDALDLDDRATVDDVLTWLADHGHAAVATWYPGPTGPVRHVEHVQQQAGTSPPAVGVLFRPRSSPEAWPLLAVRGERLVVADGRVTIVGAS